MAIPFDYLLDSLAFPGSFPGPNADPDYAFEQGDGWYAYDVASHVLTPRPLVWVVRTGDATAVKVAIEDYYDDVGSSGVFTLRWAPL